MAGETLPPQFAYSGDTCQPDPDAGNDSFVVVIAFQENGELPIPTLGEAGLLLLMTLLAGLGALALRRSG